MSSYLFELNDYHAVKEAKIKIDGITVLAGQNGSGKSTVSRWLHHVVYVLNQYESMVEKNGISEVTRFLGKMERALYSIVGFVKTRKFKEIIESMSAEEITTISQTTEYYAAACDIMMDLLTQHFGEKDDHEDLQRLERYFNLEAADNESAHSILEKLRDKFDREYQAILDNVTRLKETHTAETFADKLFSVADSEIEDNEIEVALSEDGIELLTDDNFKMPLMLRNAIYIDTHTIGQALSLWQEGELARMLGTPGPEVDDNARIIARIIQQIIGGDVQLVRDPQRRIRQGKFTFVSKNGKSFNLKGAATGIISFSYILQLLQHGWIKDDTLLVIDEPESHLHPQWVVEYARILVMIHKLLGAKIVVSSHNPDMVSAIQAIAQKEGLTDATRFYLSEPTDDEALYSFRDLGFEIAEIFDSFNVAIDRIAFYGDTWK